MARKAWHSRLLMKTILTLALGCAVLVGFTAWAGEGKDSKSDVKKPIDKAAAAKSEAKGRRTAEVTGSRIPCAVDVNGQPVDSTLKVTIVSGRDIAFYGLGSPGAALARLPMVSSRGR
jgi:hypothetical protein